MSFNKDQMIHKDMDFNNLAPAEEEQGIIKHITNHPEEKTKRLKAMQGHVDGMLDVILDNFFYVFKKGKAQRKMFTQPITFMIPHYVMDEGDAGALGIFIKAKIRQALPEWVLNDAFADENGKWRVAVRRGKLKTVSAILATGKLTSNDYYYAIELDYLEARNTQPHSFTLGEEITFSQIDQYWQKCIASGLPESGGRNQEMISRYKHHGYITMNEGYYLWLRMHGNMKRYFNKYSTEVGIEVIKLPYEFWLKVRKPDNIAAWLMENKGKQMTQKDKYLSFLSKLAKKQLKQSAKRTPMKFYNGQWIGGKTLDYIFKGIVK